MQTSFSGLQPCLLSSKAATKPQLLVSRLILIFFQPKCGLENGSWRSIFFSPLILQRSYGFRPWQIVKCLMPWHFLVANNRGLPHFSKSVLQKSWFEIVVLVIGYWDPTCALGMGTISPNHGRLSQKYPCDPKVNSPKGFLPTSNTQLAPERLCLPAPKISARQNGPNWCTLGVRDTAILKPVNQFLWNMHQNIKFSTYSVI